MSDKIRTLTYGGVLSAVIMLATLLSLPMPSGYGYINFGDGAIFAAASILGPFAAISAAIGSALADLIVGYSLYMPATFLIKGLMGLISGFALRRSRHMPWYMMAVLFLLCEVIMVGGYFVFEWILYGIAAASGQLLFNSLQGIAGIATGLAVVPLARRIRTNALPTDMI